LINVFLDKAKVPRTQSLIAKEQGQVIHHPPPPLFSFVQKNTDLVIAFNLTLGFFTMSGMTIRNCVSSTDGGALALILGEAHLTNMMFINNTAQIIGGAVSVIDGQLFLDGVNTFINNTAYGEGGAIGAANFAIMTISGQEVYAGNTAGANGTYYYYGKQMPENVFVDYYSQLNYPPNSSPPPLSFGVDMMSTPFAYIDPNADCPTYYSCNGTDYEPFSNFNDTLLYLFNGGTMFVMPGVYSGPLNVNLTFFFDYTISLWPGTTGNITIDCNNEGFGIFMTSGTVKMQNVVFKNCVTDNPEGGGAFFSITNIIELTDVYFIGNSAPNGVGGAISLNTSDITMSGGGFWDNWSGVDGGALALGATSARFENDVIFSQNQVHNLTTGVNTINDLSCQEGNIQNDGSVVFTVDTTTACAVAISSLNTLAVFPGSLNGILYPKNAQGSTENNIFAALDLASVVELDAKGAPIESTRITKTNLTWTLTATNFSNYWNLVYDTFGPQNQFLRVVHDFFVSTGNYTPFGGQRPITVEAGTIKTSIQIALWSFNSTANSLAVTLEANADSPITKISSIQVGDSTDYIIQTSNLAINFSTLNFAILDDVTNTPSVTVSTSTVPGGNGVAFQIDFPYFETWMAYDPQFSCVLEESNPTEGGDGGSAPVGLIVGLSIGLSALLAFIIIGAILAAGGFWVLKKRRMKTLLDRIGSISGDTTLEGGGQVPYNKIPGHASV